MRNYLQRNSLILLLLVFFIQTVTMQDADATPCDSLVVPDYRHVTYRASIDVINKHLSGILVFKSMEDSAIRVVFMNEAGVTFFALEFTNTDYRFLSIVPSLDKRSVRRTLAKDLGMILMRGIYQWPGQLKPGQHGLELRLKRKGHVVYSFREDCRQYAGIANFGRRKKVVSIIQTFQGLNPVPDSIFVEHHTVHFTISLKQIHVTE